MACQFSILEDMKNKTSARSLIAARELFVGTLAPMGITAYLKMHLLIIRFRTPAYHDDQISS